MNATMDTPKLEKGQVEKISAIWDQLERIFGRNARDPEFLKKYINYSDGRPKKYHDLLDKLLELQETDKVKAE